MIYEALIILLTIKKAICPSTSPTTLRGGFSLGITPVRIIIKDNNNYIMTMK